MKVDRSRSVGSFIARVNEIQVELAAFGVVEFCEDGRAKRPVVRFDELVIDIRMGDGIEDSQTVSA